MKLIEPTLEYEDAIRNFRNEFIFFGGPLDGCGSLKRFDKVKDWINQLKIMKSRETCPSHLVPQTQFLYYREEDRKVVGVIQIRHYFNEYLEKYAGHIGYSICPSERQKGYGKAMLKEVLPYCKTLGIKDVLICCLTDNIASRKVILANGGIYESTVYDPIDEVYLERYWIHLD